MSERYSRVFVLPEIMYSAESPIIIENAGLLKDNKTGKILAQLKMVNISDKKVKAVKVKLDCYDTAHNHIDEPVVFEFLDLDANRDDPFGSKTPIPIPNATVREFEAKVVSVVFEDHSSLSLDAASWKPLPKQKELKEVLGADLSEQYKRDVSESALYEPITFDGLWKCFCGALNHTAEHRCHSCNQEKAKQFLALDHNTLAENKAAFEKAVAQKKFEEAEAAKKRAEAEAEAAKKRAEAKAMAAKKRKKIIIIVASVLAVVLAALLVLFVVIIPGNNYKKGQAELSAGNYEDAIVSLEANKNHKESDSLLREVKYLYALELIDDLNYTKAGLLLADLDGYKDSERLKADISFATAQEEETLTLGSYNGKEIEWYVVRVDGNRKLIVSKDAVCLKPYDDGDDYTGLTWENCSLRKWLNEGFYREALSNAPQAKYIVESTISTGCDTGHFYFIDTIDKVFLLSRYEVSSFLEEISSGLWWLRSFGGDSFPGSPDCLHDDGEISGFSWHYELEVHPAMWIDITGIK